MQTLSHNSYPLPSDTVNVKVMNLSVLNHMLTRVTLIYLIFKNTVLIVRISSVQTENMHAFGESLKLYMASNIKTADLFTTALTRAICSPSLCLCFHLANEMYVSQKKDSSCPHLHNSLYLPSFIHFVLYIHLITCPLFHIGGHSVQCLSIQNIQENLFAFIVKRNCSVLLIYESNLL